MLLFRIGERFSCLMVRRHEPVTHFHSDWCAPFRRLSHLDIQSENLAGDRTAVETFVRSECSRESRKRRRFR